MSVNYSAEFSELFENDIAALKKENNKTGFRLLEIIFSVLENPFEGIGKPEPLKGAMRGSWSRRITDTHRLIYTPKTNKTVLFISCFGHYDEK